MADSIIRRHLTPRVVEAMGDTPVVLVIGPRQAGKTTLCEQTGTAHGARLLSFDDAGTLASAQADPAGFIASLDGPIVLDEIQRVPSLLPAIKRAVDRHRTPGRFLLTGSANVLALPRISESLAGRVELLTLWPFSQGEIDGRHEGFVDALFSSRRPEPVRVVESRSKMLRRALAGGYPEAVRRSQPDRRRAWFGSYITTILQRDIRDLAAIDSLTAMPTLLSLMAARAASLLNLADLSRSTGLPHTTLTRYVALLEATFLVRLVPAWSAGRAKRLLKSPRLMLGDTGLLAYLSGLTESSVARNSTALGPLFENFVAMELTKQLSWSRTRAEIFHFRSYAGQEVDLVLEAEGGRIAGIEVKAAGAISDRDFNGLRALREIAGDRFHRGIVLYTGGETLPFGPSMWAMPMNAVWS